MLVEKLGKLLEARYGTGLEIKNILSLENNKPVQSNSSYWVGEQLHIPLRKNNAVLGTAVITKAKNLSEDAQRNIADLVQFIMEPAAYNQSLQNMVNNLEHTTTGESEKDSSNNIYHLNNYKKVSEDEDYEEINALGVMGNGFITPVVHLYSKSYDNKLKVAHALHELSQRWIFAHFQDVKDEIHTLKDLKDMGQATLFIPDVLQLSLTEQKLIGQYLNSDPNVETDPLILIGSQFQFSEITQTPAVHESLKPDLLGFYLDIDTAILSHPNMSYQKMTDILELMFLK